MPYIKTNDRVRCDTVVNSMVDAEIKANGDLNYVLYKYCKHFYPHSYNNLKNFCGELRQCATEIERRILAQYEDEKIIENGDV
jgi:hypothetical protein